MFQYRASGLTIESDVRLPAMRAVSANGSAEVSIRHGSVPIALDDARHEGPNWQFEADRILIRIPEVGRFLISGGRRIEFEVEHDRGVDDLAAFLGGSIFGVLLQQRGLAILHASATIVGGTAVLFCGRSGAGKSTLAAALAATGLGVATDDQAVLTTGADGGLVLHPDGRMLKLWDEAIVALALHERRGEAIRQRLGKFYVTPEDEPATPIPVGAVYLINDPRHRGPPEISRLNIVDAARGIIANAYRPSLVKQMNQRATYLEMAARIGGGHGIYRLRRRVAFEALDETIAALRAHWDEIGLSAA